jgi:hypothetical protein
VAILAPDATLATKVIGTYGIGVGTDEALAAITGLISGEHVRSSREQGVDYFTQDQQLTDKILFVTDLGVDGFDAHQASRAWSNTTKLVPPNGGRYLDPKSVSDFSLAERLDLRAKHQSLIKQLERGQDVHMPSGAASSKLLGEITAATGREVGLIRLEGKRWLRMGSADSIDMSDASRVIAHTHPSGDLRFSGLLGGSDGDISMFRLYQPRQRSSGLIAPDGTFVLLPIPR